MRGVTARNKLQPTINDVPTQTTPKDVPGEVRVRKTNTEPKLRAPSVTRGDLARLQHTNPDSTPSSSAARGHMNLRLQQTTSPDKPSTPVDTAERALALVREAPCTATGAKLLRFLRARLSRQEITNLVDHLYNPVENPAGQRIKADLRLRSALMAAHEILVSRGSAKPANLPFYDELFLQNGETRPRYRMVLKHFLKLDSHEGAVEKLQKRMRKDQCDLATIAVLPRLITESEYAHISAGVRQRGQALQKLAVEVHGGGKTYQQVLPEKVVKLAMMRLGDSKYLGKISPELAHKTRFQYGPDIIRDASGKWRIVEDNHGPIGGIGVLKWNRDTYERRVPMLEKDIDAINDPETFYDAIIERARSITGDPEAKLVVLDKPRTWKHPLIELLENKGAILVRPNQTHQKLEFQDGNTYLVRETEQGTKRDRVGYIYEAGSLEWYDRLIPQSQSDKPGHARKPTAVPGLMNAILTGSVESSASPGIRFLGDKLVGSYVDDLIRLYLGEEPLVPSIDTMRFVNVNAAGEFEADPSAIAKLTDSKDTMVLKNLDLKCGGHGVVIGPKVSQEEWQKSVDDVRAHPENWIAQAYTHPSIVGTEIVDMRCVTLVDENGIQVSGTPWGRAVGLQGDGKVNISQEGSCSVIFDVPDEHLPQKFRSAADPV